MALDAAFENAGQKVGLEIWRIEKLKVVAQDPKSYGDFYSGDSYIILSTKKHKNSPKLEWDLHFWLGTNTSQDEKGVAAYKTVELDDGLGGSPVQYREVQEHESKLFLSYFKHGIRYFEGGVDSGFKKVEAEKYETRLLHVKGRRNIRVKQVKCDVSSLNQGDVFILDCGQVIFVWNGPKSSKMEQIKAAEVARRIKDDERAGKALIKIIEQRWETDASFFKALGSTGPIASADAAGDDRVFENADQHNTKLYRISDVSGKLEMNEVGCEPLTPKLLDSNDCFILDSGSSGIFAWIGRKCTKNEKKSAWKIATEFLFLRGYPDWTPVVQVVEGGETPLFKQFFTSWDDQNAQFDMWKNRREKFGRYSTEETNCSLSHQKRSEERNFPDSGSGKAQDGNLTKDINHETDQQKVRGNYVLKEQSSLDKKHPYSELIKRTLPKDVDPTCKEIYLTDVEFQNIFKMTFDQYSSLKQWKQLELKKRVGLF